MLRSLALFSLGENVEKALKDKVLCLGSFRLLSMKRIPSEVEKYGMMKGWKLISSPWLFDDVEMYVHFECYKQSNFQLCYDLTLFLFFTGRI